MAGSSLKEIVAEVVQAVEACPEALQEKAFEMLLEYRLGLRTPVRRPPAQASPQDGGLTEEEADDVIDEVDDDIQQKDLHAKTRKFLEDFGLGIGDINALFYVEDGEIKPLYDDLKSTGMSESQIRLGLLEALENALETGEFEFSGESVRDKAKAYKCYDSPNFTRNFRNNKNLFDGFESYDATQPIKLSTEGKAELARVITQLG